MTTLTHLGDRHLRPDPSGALASAENARKGSVRVIVAPSMASVRAGQHASWMLINQLVRQDRLVECISIYLPDTPLLDQVLPFGHAPTLSGALVQWAQEVAADRVRLVLNDSDVGPVDVEIHLGNVEVQLPAVRHVSIFGEGWNAYAGPPRSAPQHIPSDSNPLGPYFAACLGAGETFKHLRQINPGRGTFIDRLAYSLFDLRTYSSWSQLPIAPLPGEIQIPNPYLIGGGAVGQAFALAIGSIPGIRGHLTVVDPQSLDDITNLNRYSLARLDDFFNQRSKTEIVATYLRSRGVSVHPAQMKWEDFLRRVSVGDQLPELAQMEQRYRFPLILSCVDDTDGNHARHAIQNVWPRTLIGASTHGDGLRASVSEYQSNSGRMCLKCHNPIRDSRKELESLVARLRDMPADERAIWTSEHGLSAQEVEEALSDPGCTSVGMRHLSDYVSRPGDPQFSVGFTSIAAGIILAAQLLKLSIGQVVFPADQTSHFFYFLNPGARSFPQGPNPTCNCQTQGKERYRTFWGDL